LNVDLFGIQVYTLCSTLAPFLSVKSCYLYFLPELRLIFYTGMALLIVLSQPGPLLYPGTSQYDACHGRMCQWSIHL